MGISSTGLSSELNLDFLKEGLGIHDVILGQAQHIYKATRIDNAFSANNTADTTFTLASTTANATISISSPTQANQFMTVPSTGIPAVDLTLVITNDAASQVNAANITVTDITNCPNLSVTASACANLGIGQTCNLTLSSNTPYAPCTISIKGTNTNTVTTKVAFQYLNGWVFESNGTNGKVSAINDITYISETSQPGQAWTSSNNSSVGGTDLDDGQANTNAIVGDASCSANNDACAAYRCINILPKWYLPSRNELQAVYEKLKSNQFGHFEDDTYWSSSEPSEPSDPPEDAKKYAWSFDFSTGFYTKTDKTYSVRVRCVSTF